MEFDTKLAENARKFEETMGIVEMEFNKAASEKRDMCLSLNNQLAASVNANANAIKKLEASVTKNTKEIGQINNVISDNQTGAI